LGVVIKELVAADDEALRKIAQELSEAFLGGFMLTGPRFITL
jgi:hypothetical protein